MLGLPYTDLGWYASDRSVVRALAAPSGRLSAAQDVIVAFLDPADPGDPSPAVLLPAALRGIHVSLTGAGQFQGTAEYVVGGRYLARFSCHGVRVDGACTLDRIWLTGRGWGIERKDGADWTYFEEYGALGR